MPWNKKKSYNLLKLNKKDSSSSGSYTKKKDRNKKFSPSSSNSSAKSTTGLISKLPKQTNIKKVHKIL